MMSSTPGEKKDEALKEETMRTGSDKKKRSDSYVEEPPVKKSKSSDDTSATDEPVVVKEETTPVVVKDTAMEAEVKAAQQRAIIPLEERVQQFKEMLAEKEVLSNCWDFHFTVNILFNSHFLFHRYLPFPLGRKNCTKLCLILDTFYSHPKRVSRRNYIRYFCCF